jgi:hypothetical protein
MPVKGTEVFKNLLGINPYLKSVMFTGEADFHDAEEARGLKYDETLWKSKVKQLPEVIFRLYSKYDRDIEREQTQRIEKKLKIKMTPREWLKNRSISYYIMDIIRISDKHTSDDSWKTIRRIEKNEVLEETITHEINDSIAILSNSVERLRSSFSLSDSVLEIFKSELVSEIKNTVETTVNLSKQEKIERKVKVSISSDEKNESGAAIVSRSYEYSQVSYEYKVNVKNECSRCNSESVIPILIYVPRNIIFYRNKDFFDDETMNITLTGDFQF